MIHVILPSLFHVPFAYYSTRRINIFAVYSLLDLFIISCNVNLVLIFYFLVSPKRLAKTRQMESTCNINSLIGDESRACCAVPAVTGMYVHVPYRPEIEMFNCLDVVMYCFRSLDTSECVFDKGKALTSGRPSWFKVPRSGTRKYRLQSHDTGVILTIRVGTAAKVNCTIVITKKRLRFVWTATKKVLKRNTYEAAMTFS